MTAPIEYRHRQPPTAHDIQTLKILALAHLIFGGLGLLAGLFVALSTLSDPEFQKLALALLMADLLCLISGLCMLFTRFRIISMFIACITCVIFPLGTIVGIWALIVLSRPQIKDLYNLPTP